MTDLQHTPLTDTVREVYSFAGAQAPSVRKQWFDRWLATVEAAAEQRGAEKAFRKTQEIIAGFEHTIDEARERDDMINTGYLIQEIDTEIQDLQEDDDETH